MDGDDNFGYQEFQRFLAATDILKMSADVLTRRKAAPAQRHRPFISGQKRDVRMTEHGFEAL